MRTERNLHSSSSLHATAVAAAFVAVACSAEPPTGIVLEIRSELTIPEEINELFVRARDRAGRMLFRQTYLLHGPERISLGPGDTLGKIGLELDTGVESPLEIDVIARLGSRPMVYKTVRLGFDRLSVRHESIVLDRDCLRIYCPRGQTCGPRGLCTAPDLPLRPPDETGPWCKCFDLFPICVGARFTYDQIQYGQRIERYKTWFFSSYGPIDDTRHGKQTTKAFLQVRPSAVDLNHKWISVQDGKGPARIAWEKEVQYDENLNPTWETLFEPQKIRVDPTLMPEAPFTESYKEYVYRTGDPSDRIYADITNEDDWTVIPVEKVVALPDSHFVGPYTTAKGIVCHHRFGRPINVMPKDLEMMFGRTTEKIFCFVHGIGKVYERSLRPTDSEEILVDYHIPDCPGPKR